jgi:SAM-dependent methyltransferase
MTFESSALGFGRDWFAPLSSAAMALATCENRWHSALIHQIAPRARQTIADVGCGAGALTVKLKTHAPSASVYGFDPDPKALNRAERKARAAGALIHFTHATLDDILVKLSGVRPAHVVSSFVFHALSMEDKRRLLKAMHVALLPGGQLHIAGYAWPHPRFLNIGSRVGWLRARPDQYPPDAGASMPLLMREAGFHHCVETAATRTLTGSISLYRAAKL